MRMTLRFAAAAGLLLFAGCNLYNPSGEGPASEDLVLRGEEQYRDRQYAAAMATFEKAIAQDSNRSLAYYGYAKATVKFYRLSKLSVLNDLDSTNKGADFAFINNHSDSVLSLRLQAGRKVRLLMSLLTERDTLTRWYSYLRDSTSRTARADTLRDARIAFIQNYLTRADSGVAGYRARARFPLTDFRMPYDKVVLEFTAYEMMYVFTSKLLDFDQNDTIDSRDDLMKKLKFGKGDGGFKIDSLSKIADDLADPQTAEDMNTLIQGMASGVGNLGALASLIKFSTPKKDSADTSSDANQKTSGNIDSVLARMGDAIAFYQFGDHLDNDGDGCIDEELLDDQDNDGDGFVDEDARVTNLPLFEGVDNDRNGKKNELDSGFINGSTKIAMEDPVGAANINASQPSPYVLGFIHLFYSQHPDSTGKFIKIKKGADNMDLRTRIQKDSLATKSASQLNGPLKAKLDSAKILVGGCWRNYPAGLAAKQGASK